MPERKSQWPTWERQGAVTQRSHHVFDRRYEAWETARNNRLQRELDARRISSSSEYDFLAGLYMDLKTSESTHFADPNLKDASVEYAHYRNLWRLIPAPQAELFHTSSRSSLGSNILFENLTLGNICGNLYPDYIFKSIEYSEWGIGPTYKGPLHWLPKKEEMERFTQIAQQVAGGLDTPRVLEVGAGNGLLSLLLAQTGKLDVTGMDPNDAIWKPGEINYEHPNLKLLPGTSDAAKLLFGNNPPDVVISSWMTPDADLTDDIVALAPKAIIYVYSAYFEDLDSDGQFATRFSPKPGYHRAFSWKGTTQDDILNWWEFVASERGKKKERGMISTEELKLNGNNVIEIHLRDGIKDVSITKPTTPDKYSWESDDLTQLLTPDVYESFSRKPKKLKKLKEGLSKILSVKDLKVH